MVSILANFFLIGRVTSPGNSCMSSLFDILQSTCKQVDIICACQDPQSGFHNHHLLSFNHEMSAFFYLHGDYFRTNSQSDVFRQMPLQDVLFLQKNCFSELISRKSFRFFAGFRQYINWPDSIGWQLFYGFRCCLTRTFNESFRSATSRSSVPLPGATHG
jgi:hypothetical protein